MSPAQYFGDRASEVEKAGRQKCWSKEDTERSIKCGRKGSSYWESWWGAGRLDIHLTGGLECRSLEPSSCSRL